MLLLCVSPEQDQESADRIRALAAGEIDWDYLFTSARRHGVLPLFFYHLQKTAADLIPSDELQRLQKYFQENSARNVLLAAELRNLIDVLGREGIEAIPYKGPLLALFAYDNIALRRFVDLDIMVQKEAVAKAIDILIAEGYELSKPLSLSQQQILLRTQHNVQFRRHNRQLIVELHWEVVSHLFASSVQAGDLWKGLEVTELNGASVMTLSVEDLIFSLCVHGSRHLWERLLWICDIGWVVARHELNWRSLLERARQTNTERMFLLGLQLCDRLLNVRLPVSIRDEISKDPQLDKLAEVVVKRLFDRAEHRPLTAIKMFEFNVRIRKSWMSRARYFRHMLDPTDGDLNGIVLPRPLSFGYYLMRPFRLLFKTGPDLH